jgi:hypothetical protein
MRRIGRAEVGLVGDLVVGQLVVVRRGDVNDAGGTRRGDEPLHRGNRLLGTGNRELPAGEHEVDLRVDVPENHVTRVSCRFGL